MKSKLSFLILTQLFVPFALIQGAKDKNSESQDSNRTVSVKINQEEAEGKEVKAKTHETLHPERKLFKIDLTLEGFLEDSQAKALDYPVEHWQELKVVTAPVLGKEVKRGDLLLRLNLEKIKQEIQRLNNDLAMLDLNREILDTELELAESLAPMKQNEIDRMEAYAKEDLERFKKTDLPFQKKSSQMSLKRQEQYLSYSLEELNQLKKMYEADDLTEETEEIIIQRAQNDVDQARFYVDSARKSFKEFNEVLVPRSERSIMEAYKRENLSFEALRKIEPAQLKKQRLERKKLEEERKILAAIFMGYSQIHLLGVDFNFEWSGENVSKKNVLIGKGEMNHFHKDYRPIGEKWSVPKMNISGSQYVMLKEFATSMGVKIINSSRGGKLEVFDRIPLEKVLKET